VDPAVSVRGLGRTFGDIQAVSDLTIDVGRGELFGIVGPDGAGKTTTLRMLAGVLRPSSGEISLEGVDVVADPESAKPHLAYMAQRFGLYEDLTVQENLDFYSDLYTVPRSELRERADRLYEFSRLGEFRDRLAGKLSGGMKQKLSLSCCLIHQPAVLLLDEPTFGVDPISRRELWLILHEMVAGGVTVIVSTSYLDEAERCDRVALLHEGRVLALDTPFALQQRMTGSMLAIRTQDPRKSRDILRTVAGTRGATLFGDTVHARVADPREADSIRALLEEDGMTVTDIDEIDPSLEDVFIHLVADHSSPSGPEVT